MSLDTVNYLDIVVDKLKNSISSYITSNVIKHYNPDINGYTLIFFIPPALSGLSENQKDFKTSEFTST